MITQEELKELLHYDSETGVFTWITSPNRRMKAGSIAGALQNGYVVIKVKGYTYYRAHKLAFLYMTGEFPSDQVDHVNRVKNDNRWENLRQCTHQQNTFNRKRRTNTSSGYNGVYRDGTSNKWTAGITVSGRYIRLGLFVNKVVASRVYESYLKKFHGEFANLGE